MREYARSGDGAVIVGGGLLGLEAAKVLSDMGLHVTVVDSSKILMNAQLDEIAGEMLARQIDRTGIFARLGRTLESIYGDERVTSVVLDDGTTLSTDLVVLACGVRPRVDTARASGLPVNKGILVNDTLATEVPGVYAFGECAEHRGKTYGIVTPVWEQAAVLADVLTGQAKDRYRGSKLYTRLKVAGVDVASMGALEPELERDEVLQIVEERRDCYQEVDRARRQAGGRHVGGQHRCDRRPGPAVRIAAMPCRIDPLELLCLQRALAPAGERMVCNCNKVTEQALCDAIAAGADSVSALSDCTRAGSGCGSCKGELTQLLSKFGKPAQSLPPLPLLASA